MIGKLVLWCSAGDDLKIDRSKTLFMNAQGYVSPYILWGNPGKLSIRVNPGKISKVPGNPSNDVEKLP